jgi:hypothetical protein
MSNAKDSSGHKYRTVTDTGPSPKISGPDAELKSSASKAVTMTTVRTKKAGNEAEEAHVTEIKRNV